MKSWRLLTGRQAKRQPAAVPALPGLGEDDESDEPREEVDLIALKSTPQVFHEEECDVLKYELDSLSTDYTQEEISEVKELRQRQLDVRCHPQAVTPDSACQRSCIRTCCPGTVHLPARCILSSGHRHSP